MTTSKDGVEVTVHGMKEFSKMLNDIPFLQQISILRSIHKEAGKKVIVPALRASLPFSANTRKRITAGVATGRSKVNPSSVLVGVGRKAFFLRFLERGTVDRKTRKRSVRKYSRSGPKTGGAARGKIRGKRRVEPVVDRQVPNVIKYLEKYYGEMVDKYLKRSVTSINKKVARFAAKK